MDVSARDDDLILANDTPPRQAAGAGAGGGGGGVRAAAALLANMPSMYTSNRPGPGMKKQENPLPVRNPMYHTSPMGGVTNVNNYSGTGIDYTVPTSSLLSSDDIDADDVFSGNTPPGTINLTKVRKPSPAMGRRAPKKLNFDDY
jgi:hypothetical protein